MNETATESASSRSRPTTAAALGLVEVLATGDEAQQAEARSYLDRAIDELQAMKMQPALERALASKELLKA